jgi:hypothetical protein
LSAEDILVAFDGQQPAFHVDSVWRREAADFPACRENSMTGNDQWHSVLGHRRTNSSRGSWLFSLSCEFAVSHCRPHLDSSARFQNSSLKFSTPGVIDFQIEKTVGISIEKSEYPLYDVVVFRLRLNTLYVGATYTFERGAWVFCTKGQTVKSLPRPNCG